MIFMMLMVIMLLEFVNGHSQQEKPKPRNLLHCGPTGSWNVCQNHRVWPSNGYKGDAIGNYPVDGGHPCVGKFMGETNDGQNSAMSKPGEIQVFVFFHPKDRHHFVIHLTIIFEWVGESTLV